MKNENDQKKTESKQTNEENDMGLGIYFGAVGVLVESLIKFIRRKLSETKKR